MKLWTLSIALLASCAHSPTSSQVAFPVGGAESTTSITKGSDPLPLLVAAGESGRSVGIDSYRIYRGQQLGGETLDVIDLLDKDNQFIGQVMGGLLQNAGDIHNYIFSVVDLVGHPPLQCLAAGGRIYFYSNEQYIGQVLQDTQTGEVSVFEDKGLAMASATIPVQAAVASDAVILYTLSEASSATPGNDSHSAATSGDDCPWWVATTACGTCAACMWVGEAPPPCWGACLTCGACLGIKIPKPKPGPRPTPPKPRPRPYPTPMITHASPTMVHTPSGLVQLGELTVGDAILSRNDRGQVVVATVKTVTTRQAEIESVMYVDGDAIMSTRGHKMMNQRGWIPAEKIATGDVLNIYGAYVEVTSLPAEQTEIGQTSVTHITLNGGMGYFVGEAGLYSEAY